jgi:hypothetical protein
VLAGRTALRITSQAGGSFEAGVRQTVRGLAPGTRLRFEAHGLAWVPDDNASGQPAGAGRANLRLGLDPQGGSDPRASAVVWSPPRDPWDQYERFQVEAVAVGGEVTLYLEWRPAQAPRHSQVYWDNAALYSAMLAGETEDNPPVPQDVPEPEAKTASLAPEAGEQAAAPNLPPEGESPAGANLLRNPGFGEGYYFKTPELAAPADWDLWYADEDEARLDRQELPFAKAESEVRRAADASDAEREKYFRGGGHVWRVRSEWKPAWVRLEQRVTGLTPGRTYRFSVPVLAEPWAVFEGRRRAFAADPAAAEGRLRAQAGGAAVTTGWLGGEDAPWGEHTVLSLDFTAEADEAVVSLDLRARWGLARTQWVVSGAFFSSQATAPGVPRQ